MFNKSKSDSSLSEASTVPARESSSDMASASVREPSGRALIGPRTQVTGEILGDENLHIEGTVIGTVTFRHHTVSIGSEGRVEGDVIGHSLSVSGHVEGRLIAAQSVTIHAGASVEGEIHSPGLILKEGAAFQGTVDMNPHNPLLDDIFGNDMAQPRQTSLDNDLSCASAEGDVEQSEEMDEVSLLQGSEKSV